MADAKTRVPDRCTSLPPQEIPVTQNEAEGEHRDGAHWPLSPDSTSVALRCVPKKPVLQAEALGQANRPFPRKAGAVFSVCCVWAGPFLLHLLQDYRPYECKPLWPPVRISSGIPRGAATKFRVPDESTCSFLGDTGDLE